MTNQPEQRNEIVGDDAPVGGLWRPAVGEEAQELLDRLPHQHAEKLRARDEALAILAGCVPVRGPARTETGLVIGYVQSGKTLSFTLLAALARDNGYRVVIVITGTSKPLFKQSTDRLSEDLLLETRSDQRWMTFANPRVRTDRQSVEAALRDWDDPLVAEHEKRCIVITVMKHHGHLDHLTRLFSNLDLSEVPVLVVDDEADQASLNTQVRKQDESATYRRLRQLRALFPRHAYIQYTATPQAPLLINVIDLLSPSFAELLTPGADYLGGRDIFLAPGQPLVRVIPAVQIPGPDNEVTEPPDTLIEALACYVVGAAAFLAGDRARERNRSMMVHPSRETAGHADYRLWVENIRGSWLRSLQRPDGDPDRDETLADLRPAHADLQSTNPSIRPFAELSPYLVRALQQTIVTEVNTRRHNATQGTTPDVNWQRDPLHILVGGQALDRGVTVKGLTVTYMPRSVGLGNADTVQQRARFFGYKRSYQGYCRIYVGLDVQAAFVTYVRHEEDIRRRLADHRATGAPLVAWKRAFFLDPMLRPTRDSVLDLNYIRGNYRDDWYFMRSPHKAIEAIENNRGVVKEFLASVARDADPGHPGRTSMQIHAVGTTSLEAAYSDLLIRLRIPYAFDSQNFTGLLLQVREYLDQNPEAQCTVFEMSRGQPRERTVNADEEIPNLFQGPNPDRTGAIYPGDRNIRTPGELTIQIHVLNVLFRDGPPVTDVPAVAVWVPAIMARAWLNQPGAGA